jgi:hypothetical protein
MARIAILGPFEYEYEYRPPRRTEYEYEKKHEQNLFELIHDKKS